METRWGKLLGRYEIVAEVGHGAMGVVYKARDPKIDRYVAIKTTSMAGATPDAQREFRSRFFIEAQAAGRLLHPGIVTVFDVGEDPESNNPYIVMEYIEGQTLRELLSGRPEKLPLEAALQITEEVAEALDYAHAQGVVHRDIKPENILVTKEGLAKISDFGIAQLDLSRVTLAGRVIGTPEYMSPEQLEGMTIDGRSDLFSLGALFYTLLTGFSPFQGNSAITVCFKVANRDPLHATVLDPELPRELDAVLERALAKDPADRYQRGMEFALDVRELRQRMQTGSNPNKGGLWFTPAGGSAWVVDGTKTGTSKVKPALVSSARTSPRSMPQQTKGNATILRSRPVIASLVAILLVGVAVSLSGWRKKTEPAAAEVTTQKTPPVGGELQVVKDAPVVKNAPILGNVVAAPIRVKPQAPRTTAAPVSDSNLLLNVDNPFSDATISLLVDNKLVYTHPLRNPKKKLLLMRGGSKETVTIPVASGRHLVRVRLQSATDAYDATKTVAGNFPRNGENVLAINFDKRSKEMLLDMH